MKEACLANAVAWMLQGQASEDLTVREVAAQEFDDQSDEAANSTSLEFGHQRREARRFIPVLPCTEAGS